MGKTISVDESSVYGRNDDKEAIIENLLSADENGLEVISIIGMGGIGKTLFTKLVYSDIRVQNWFDITVWVCAAAKFDIFKIAKDILEEVSAKSCDFKSPIPNREILPALKGRLMGYFGMGNHRHIPCPRDFIGDSGTNWLSKKASLCLLCFGGIFRSPVYLHCRDCL
ncbi:hypothetical protein JCGZ_12397 [Jatropha curcas]|uniref:NB-ARC domain-containing protein n=1 Tax=Jatropha curcas TaxID=180498 RepID=A0A067K6R5_JATCU|nr:putative disease resistance RPP13-like protein 1 isoform X7 [Jatropha curcas]KDP31936.1 hypothetical protein JCGZ_12397 [Jatropha curcas]